MKHVPEKYKKLTITIPPPTTSVISGPSVKSHYDIKDKVIGCWSSISGSRHS